MNALSKSMFVAVTLAACLSQSCLKNPTTIWSTTTPSPDGHWIAGARTQGWSGPGIGTAASSVYLVRAQGKMEPQDVVGYLEGAGDDPHPQIKWLSATELLVRVPARKELNLQTVKFAEIEIKVEELPIEASTSSRSPSSR